MPIPQGVKEHEASCKKNPDVKPGDTSAWYMCRLCKKKIKHHRSLLRPSEGQTRTTLLNSIEVKSADIVQDGARTVNLSVDIV